MIIAGRTSRVATNATATGHTSNPVSTRAVSKLIIASTTPILTSVQTASTTAWEHTNSVKKSSDSELTTLNVFDELWENTSDNFANDLISSVTTMFGVWNATAGQKEFPLWNGGAESTLDPSISSAIAVGLWSVLGACAVVFVLIVVVLGAAVLSKLCCSPQSTPNMPNIPNTPNIRSGPLVSASTENVPAGAPVVAYDSRTGAPVFLQLADSYPLGRPFLVESSHTVQNSQLSQFPVTAPPLSPPPSYSDAVQQQYAQRSHRTGDN